MHALSSRLKRIIQFTLFGLLCVAIGYLVLKEPLPRPTDAKQANAILPDYEMDNVHRVEQAADGKPGYILNVKRWRHYIDEDFSEMDMPEITFQQADTVWHVKANHGKSIEKNTKVLLWGDVRVERRIKGSPPVVVTTTKATFWPEKNMAETDAPVTIIQGANKVHAIGMQAFLETQQIKLLSKVRGYYDPTDN